MGFFISPTNEDGHGITYVRFIPDKVHYVYIIEVLYPIRYKLISSYHNRI